MSLKHSRLTAIALGFAVWFAYSVPAYGVTRANLTNFATTIIQGNDDDDDVLSGWALAVLLLAVGGAVAGVLYAAHPGGVGDKIVWDRANNEVTLKISNSDATGKNRSSTWSAKLDEKSGTITLSKKTIDAAGKPVQSQWTGKVDGKFYSVQGNPTADAIAYTKIDANTLAFRAKKADRVTLTSRLVVSANRRSFTMNTERTDVTGRRIMKQTVFNAAR